MSLKKKVGKCLKINEITSFDNILDKEIKERVEWLKHEKAEEISQKLQIIDCNREKAVRYLTEEKEKHINKMIGKFQRNEKSLVILPC